MSFAAEGIFGGALLGVKSSGFLCFYDWETGVCVRRVDVVAKNVRGVLWFERRHYQIILMNRQT